MEYVMPNWCENILVVMGEKEQVEKFKEVVEDGGMFEKHLPTPAALLNTEAFNKDLDAIEKFKTLHGARDWYDWRINNWGTKWDVQDIDVKETDNIDDNLVAYVFTFDTAWAPPEIGIETISGMYKDIVFHLQFEEPGMAFEGFCRCLNGETIASQTNEMYEKWDTIVDNLRYDWEYTMKTYKKDDN